nr:hypothetical protein CFP56_58037 [Quercus suber]
MEGDIDGRHKHRRRPPLKDPHHCSPKHRPPTPKDDPSLQVLALSASGAVTMEGDIDGRHKHRRRPPLKDPHHCSPKHRPPTPKDDPSLQVLAPHSSLIYDYKCYKACVKAECKYIAMKNLEECQALCMVKCAESLLHDVYN